MPKVSIVLPSYNGERYIRESIDSVLCQTFSDWELIIVDDCSTDSTPEIAEEYARKDSRIQVIHNSTNQRLPESLNVGFRQSKGELLSWTSDDNIYLSHALEEMSQYLDQNPEMPMVCADMLFMDEEMRYLKEAERYDEVLMHMDDVVGAAFMYRRKVLEEVGEYSSTFFCVEDYEYWIRILQNYGSIGHIEKILYLYRFQPNSLSAAKAKRVQYMRGQLRLKYLDWFLSGIGNNRRILIALYNDLMANDQIFQSLRETIIAAIPELAGERPLIEDVPIILFGTGDWGQRTYELIPSQVIAFVDSDPKKIGKKKNGIPILSPDMLRSKKNNYQIVVSVGYARQLEVIQQLINLGISQYSIYSRILWKHLKEIV